MATPEDDPPYTRAAQNVLLGADFEARWRGQKDIGLEYLLFELTKKADPFTQEALASLNITTYALESVLNTLDPPRPNPPEGVEETAEFEQAVELAINHSERQRRLVEPKDLLLASTWVPLTARFGQVLHLLGTSYPQYRNTIQDALRE